MPQKGLFQEKIKGKVLKKIQVVILQHFIVIQDKMYDSTFALQMS